MKTTLISASLAAILVALVALVPSVRSQGPAAPSGVNIAVIDIGLVFDQHAGFKQQMDILKADVKRADEEFQATAKSINARIAEFKDLKPDQPQYHQMEAEIAKAQSDLKLAQALKNKDFMEKQGKVYLNTYREIEDAVAQLAQANNIGLVIRYNAKPIDPADPQSILQGIQRPIVYQYRLDVTDLVVKSVNRSTGHAVGDNRGSVPQGIGAPR